MPAASNRTYAAAHFALELDGHDQVGLFRSIEGGSVRADVMTYQNGANYDRWRQLGKPKFEDIKLQVGMSMSGSFYAWIEKFFAGNAVRKNGAIVAADFYYAERARREFTEAMIKELTFPKLEASDKSAAYMNVSLSVEGITFKPGAAGKKLAPPPGFNQQKLWTACNFTFSLDGFEQACKRVSKIDSFTIKQNVIEHHVGGMRAPIKTPSSIEFPNLSFYLPEADAQPFFTAFTDTGIKGDAPPPPRRTGNIQTHDNSGKLLFTLHYYGADLLSVTPDRADSGSEDIKQVKIEMYVESMSFEYA